MGRLQFLCSGEIFPAPGCGSARCVARILCNQIGASLSRLPCTAMANDIQCTVANQNGLKWLTARPHYDDYCYCKMCSAHDYDIVADPMSTH